jgi:hypothetical protein
MMIGEAGICCESAIGTDLVHVIVAFAINHFFDTVALSLANSPCSYLIGMLHGACVSVGGAVLVIVTVLSWPRGRT